MSIELREVSTTEKTGRRVRGRSIESSVRTMFGRNAVLYPNSDPSEGSRFTVCKYGRDCMDVVGSAVWYGN